MAEQHSGGMPRPEEPEHRRRPPPWAVACSPYVIRINAMRDQVDAAASRADGAPSLPIDHALETIPNFHCPASSWTQDHLTRFQVVVFDAQEGRQLFPKEWAVRADDKALLKMTADGFFAPTKADVSNREWDTTKPFHGVFLHLLHILRASQSPSPRTSPIPRTMRHQAKRTEWVQAFENAVLKVTPASDTDYQPPMSISSLQADLGPGATSSYILMHKFLIYLALVELQVWPDYNEWQRTADAKKFPVIAGGARFQCETDGAIYAWVRKERGFRRKHRTPLCGIECKREDRLKGAARIIAQEVAEIIALASQNYAAAHPSVEPKDEAYVLSCHHTSFHITSSVVTGDYLEGLWTDCLSREQMLFVKRGTQLDLSDPAERMVAVTQVLGLMRYLIKFRIPPTA